MGKFDGLLLVSDLDSTLLKNDKTISYENKKAIDYFMSEGGKFTYITGRIPLGAKPVLSQLVPNAPFGCINGGGIYDYSKKEMIWSLTLPKTALEIVEFVDKNFPHIGFELSTPEKVYFCKKNKTIEEHRLLELFPDDLQCHYSEVLEPVAKILFADTEDKIPPLIDALKNHPLFQSFDFVRSTSEYYELLPKGASKGNVLMKLAEILNIDKNKTIAAGDNENDISMLESAGIGVAVANATDSAKAAADVITVSNEEHAIAKIIEDLDNKKLIL